MAEQLRCPRCGELMNHHANKLVTLSESDPAFDVVLNGVVQQTHTCPACANVEFRVEPPADSPE